MRTIVHNTRELTRRRRNTLPSKAGAEPALWAVIHCGVNFHPPVVRCGVIFARKAPYITAGSRSGRSLVQHDGATMDSQPTAPVPPRFRRPKYSCAAW